MALGGSNAVLLGEVAAQAPKFGSRGVGAGSALLDLQGAAVARGRAIVFLCLAAFLLVLLHLGPVTERAPQGEVAVEPAGDGYSQGIPW